MGLTAHYPPKKRWTLSECERLEQAGFLPDRYELIDGEIIEKMTQNPPHSVVLVLLTVWLQSVFGPLHIRTQSPIRMPGRHNKPEPDVAVTLLPMTEYASAHPLPADLHLVAEISDTTLLYDMNTKADLYARAGIREYWTLDIVGRCLHIHRKPSAQGYREIRVYQETETVATEHRPEASVMVATLLPALSVA